MNFITKFRQETYAMSFKLVSIIKMRELINENTKNLFPENLFPIAYLFRKVMKYLFTDASVKCNNLKICKFPIFEPKQCQIWEYYLQSNSFLNVYFIRAFYKRFWWMAFTFIEAFSIFRYYVLHSMLERPRKLIWQWKMRPIFMGFVYEMYGSRLLAK